MGIMRGRARGDGQLPPLRTYRPNRLELGVYALLLAGFGWLVHQELKHALRRPVRGPAS